MNSLELEERPVDNAHILHKHRPPVASPRVQGEVEQRVEELETELKEAHREIERLMKIIEPLERQSTCMVKRQQYWWAGPLLYIQHPKTSAKQQISLIRLIDRDLLSRVFGLAVLLAAPLDAVLDAVPVLFV
jgi:hypothetical protein